MRTTGLFSTNRVEVEVDSKKTLRIIPFGDIHRESRLFDNKEWKEFLANAKDDRYDTYFLGMGDYTDGCSTSERKAMKDMHETTIHSMDSTYKGVTTSLLNDLDFMRGRVLGIIGGNHVWNFTDGGSTDTMLANGLRAKFLGVMGFIRVVVKQKSRGKTVGFIDILAHHGKGGGTLCGSPFNTVEKMANVADADIYLMGDDHSKGCLPLAPRLKAQDKLSKNGELCLTQRQPWVGRTGSFLRANVPDEVSYNTDAARAARPLGWIEFHITLRRTQSGGQDQTELKIRGMS